MKRVSFLCAVIFAAAACKGGGDNKQAAPAQAAAPSVAPTPAPSTPTFRQVSDAHKKALDDTMQARAAWVLGHDDGCDTAPNEKERAYLAAYQDACADVIANLGACRSDASATKQLGDAAKKLDGVVANVSAICEQAAQGTLCADDTKGYAWADPSVVREWTDAKDCAGLTESMWLPRAPGE